ncbi:hypothetical protein [Reyranella massiliensis]|uniref:hypothetical protein n=1 Tax=Reyranella massiliensis TaxID=445220 RepID=UPI0002DDBC72|nr:hypothetical protein [Reyranella massiliensis]
MTAAELAKAERVRDLMRVGRINDAAEELSELIAAAKQGVPTFLAKSEPAELVGMKASKGAPT